MDCPEDYFSFPVSLVLRDSTVDSSPSKRHIKSDIGRRLTDVERTEQLD